MLNMLGQPDGCPNFVLENSCNPLSADATINVPAERELAGEISMEKYVYLYELDSVRTSAEEILRGQQAMFREIIQKGNCVIITYNQLTDAPAFLQALQYEDTYNAMLTLFANGAIRVSRYIDRAPGSGNRTTRTAAQYVLHAVEKALGKCDADADKFIFSGLPVDRGNKPLLETIRDAIRYSDPARIRDLIDIRKDMTQRARWKELGIEGVTQGQLEYVLRYVNLIWELSREPLSHVEARPADDTSVWLFTNFLEAAMDSRTEGIIRKTKSLMPYYAEAVVILRSLRIQIAPEKQLARSQWLDLLESMDRTDRSVDMARAIIDLCYNYTVEDSILEVTRTYADKEGFFEDFADRLQVFWEEYMQGVHYGNTGTVEKKQLPDWALAVRTVEASKKIKKFRKRSKEEEDALWHRLSRWGITRKILGALVYVPLFFVMDWVMGTVEVLITAPEELSLPAAGELGPMLLSAVVTTLFLGILSGLITRWITVPDISETIRNIRGGIRDLWALRREQKERTDV